VIYNGVDAERFHPKLKGAYRVPERKRLGISEDVLVLLFVGSGFERKGLRYLIKSLALIPAGQKIKLIVAGSGRITAYKGIARRYGVEEQISFLGPFSGVERLYAAADIFILPTIYEPFSNACLEAMVAGLPVITSKQNGVSELFTGELKQLILNNPSSGEEIAGKITLLFDGHRRESLGLQSRQIAGQFTWEKSVSETLALLSNAIPV
ncbi:MAG: glycosyltransferase family 4 protein, partial [Candidatus Omnitrophica bacterium]|nr:glycosyltransferase family 4 protein [Candidatus Omnitrophota bacterium]